MYAGCPVIPNDSCSSSATRANVNGCAVAAGQVLQAPGCGGWHKEEMSRWDASCGSASTQALKVGNATLGKSGGYVLNSGWSTQEVRGRACERSRSQALALTNLLSCSIRFTDSAGGANGAMRDCKVLFFAAQVDKNSAKTSRLNSLITGERVAK